ncbi:MAG TPA: 1-acyl-sn-glycerol-3-phosphate acyltransferase [Burkholderiaceae bacterium]|nr:1-acyl-sn-glycerol-3-phosphate acyltransferase [Burkholderiaceae bacterium]
MTDVDALGQRPVQLRGSRLARAVLGLAGWRVRFDGLPARQGVVIVYPHTSNWDFVVGLLAKWAIGFPLAFWGKDTLFRVPLFGRWLRWVGGVPVDRSSARGVVGDMVARMAEARERDGFLWLALAPEGTRSYRDHWRSGFYQVALGAGVPLGLAFIDYAERTVGVERFIRLSGDEPSDMAAIAAYLGHRRGLRPELATPIRLVPRHKDDKA